MDLEPVGNVTSRFGSFVEHLTRVIGHADRTKPLRDYCTGLLAAQGRKSVEPLAAVTAPGEVSAQHQKLLHYVANAPWSDERVLAKVREMVLPAIERHGPIEVWMSTTRRSLSAVRNGWARIISIAGSSARKPIVRWC